MKVSYPNNLQLAHLYITPTIELYVAEHLVYVRDKYWKKTENSVQDEHNRSFVSSLRRRVFDELSKPNVVVSKTFEWLADNPRMQALTYIAHLVGGYQFYTRERDKRSTIQNSGVTLVS